MSVPNGEKLVADYLRDDVAVAARVVGAPPSSTSTPWIKVVQLGARQDPLDPTDHLVEFFLQFDCYASPTGGQPEAKDLGDAVRDAIVVIHQGTHDGATVTGGRIVEHMRLPDDQFEPARERVILSALVWIHS